ncbi:MAG TPA: hydrogenase maturation nickel metallochaperone HypA [Bacteroidetes bacterium]|jgi:hydrogenase nickel incorporation protein HypA/HybF|nr:hydrogenase maturation nickel metallochaperone HypA [Bacteroidota bacterium]
MHELSIAQSIVDIVQANLPASGANLVKSVKIKIGQLSGVVPDSLDFCFGAITHGTSLQGATLDMEKVPFILKCRTCTTSFESEAGIVLCPKCGGTDTEVLSGTELQVVEIELYDEHLEKKTG